MIAAAAIVSCGLWLIAAGLIYLSRRPVQPAVGPRTLDLGPEPPAVANFLVNDFRVTEDAVPATLVDLAARNVVDVEQRGVGVYYIRLRSAVTEHLATYEQRVLEHLRTLALDDVVPAAALTTGPQDESGRWWRGFTAEVVADAQARGLSRDALDGRAFTILLVAAAVPASVVSWAFWRLDAGFLVLVGAGAILGWIRRQYPQRETSHGLEAASRWLGVRAELAQNEVFPTHSPLTVELWSRWLAYGAALGVAAGASRPLPMGTESDTAAWSAHGGRWRPVRVSYPRLWPPGWGVDPVVALVAGLGAVLAGSLVLYWFGPALADAADGAWTILVVGLLLVPSAAVVVGIALAVMGLVDSRTTTEVTGPILRLRIFGDEDKSRHYVAVDDGSSRAIRAWKVSPRHYLGLSQGQIVTVSATPNLGCVRWIVDETDAAAM